MNSKSIITILLAIGILALSGYILSNSEINSVDDTETKVVKNDEPKIVVEPKNNTSDVVVNDSGLEINELGNFGTISIRPLSVEEDSRCPVDVNCIQAGTVLLKIEVISNSGNSNNTIHTAKLGEEFVANGAKITLTNVSPETNSKKKISAGDYNFKFDVKKADGVVNVPSEKCYVGGCSGEICSDTDGMASNCIYREEFACYKTTKCERQTNGKCGWTETAEFKSCFQSL